MCEGVIDDLVGGPIFLALYPYFRRYGGVFKLAFGPKVFMVLSDPGSREVLKEKPFSSDKGVLAEILEPIMGQGLIPAPYAIWKNRRRQLVPGFHKAWLDHMVGLFGHCSGELVRNLDAAAAGAAVDMEERFCSVSLDIIGLAVFNYDFGSVTRNLPSSAPCTTVYRRRRIEARFISRTGICPSADTSLDSASLNKTWPSSTTR